MIKINDKTVAIIIATYNGEKFLEKQLDSIINQTYKNINIYILDDCSTDNTLKILNNYKSKYPNIYLFNNIENKGFLYSFCKLISLTCENYIAFSDQDDIWFLDKIEYQMKYILENGGNKNPLLVHSDLMVIDSEDNLVSESFFKSKKYKFNKKRDIGNTLGPCGVMGNTILINRKFVDLVFPFPTDIGFHDYFFANVAEIIGCRITLDNKLVSYRVHSSNVSNTYNNFLNKNRKKVRYPYKEIYRINVIRFILKRFNINNRDKKILYFYKDYIKKSQPNIYDIFILIKYHLVKHNIKYITRLIYKNIFWGFIKCH